MQEIDSSIGACFAAQSEKRISKRVGGLFNPVFGFFLLVGFSEYDEIQAAREKMFDEAADSIIAENMAALRELAK